MIKSKLMLFVWSLLFVPLVFAASDDVQNTAQDIAGEANEAREGFAGFADTFEDFANTGLVLFALIIVFKYATVNTEDDLRRVRKYAMLLLLNIAIVQLGPDLLNGVFSAAYSFIFFN